MSATILLGAAYARFSTGLPTSRKRELPPWWHIRLARRNLIQLSIPRAFDLSLRHSSLAQASGPELKQNT